MKTCQTILTEVIWGGDWPLFVFSMNGPKQNARSLMTPVSDTDLLIQMLFHMVGR